MGKSRASQKRIAALAGLTSVVIAGAGFIAPAAQASQPGGEFAGPSHPYRHGVVQAKGAPAASPQRTSNLKFGGGVDGIGVTTGPEKVYVVFMGSQWGTQGTDANGYTTLSGDPSGEAVRVQQLFKGLGTNNETWSGVMTQYCEGVAKGASTCGTAGTHVGYPTGGALAGVWVDTAAASPSNATGNQIAQEAVKAAGHFGNTTAAANRDAQYVILSPTGTHPDGFNTSTGQFCAWHDWNGDTTLTGGAATSPYGDVAFSNDPYVTDMGSSCGQNYVNAGSAGTLDGVTMVFGHEYAETVTDQNPAGGWTDSSGSENADKCAWKGTGGTGGSQNVTFATGSFAMQATWSNDFNGGACQISHPIVP
jgi:serine protease